MKPFVFLSVLFLLWSVANLNAQKDPKWDDTASRDWPVEAVKVSIPSSSDGTLQMAYFYKAPGAGPKPLIVSLHSWSGNYQQKDTLIHFCITRGYHYIHPDFRGPNNREAAMGSDLVISDIDDAIGYGLSQASVDRNNIHVIGVSGGGYATVLAYMKSKHNIRSFSAYVGIYNLVDWYYESRGRNAKYAGDIAAATSGNREKLDTREAKRRSPLFMETPVQERRNSRLNLYCGIHDGYTGSVPVSQTLNLYNKLVRDFSGETVADAVPETLINTMVRTRTLPGNAETGTFMGRKIIYKNQFKDLVRLVVFEGGHEMPPGDALAHVPSKTILAIGDSNGAMDNGWVDQLRLLRNADRVINTCISGNTIGFDNNGQAKLNTLKNIETYLRQAEGPLDAVVVMLGTNDCKAEFDGRFNEISENLDQLIEKIKGEVRRNPGLGTPKICIVSPPPYGADAGLAAKYQGGAARVEKLSEQFGKIAAKKGVPYLDTYSQLKPVFSYLTQDGVHLLPAGQVLLASILDENLSGILGTPGAK